MLKNLYRLMKQSFSWQNSLFILCENQGKEMRPPLNPNNREIKIMLGKWHLMPFTRVASHHQCCLSTAALKVHIGWAFQQDSCYIHIASLCYNMEKKTYKIFIIQLVCDKLMWGWNILLTYLNYSCSKATDNRLEASEQSIRTIILFKILSCTYTHILQPIDQVNSDNGRWFHQQTSLNRKRQKSWMLTYLQPWEETNQTYQVNQQPANWVL